ncbi:hypothetical protein UFOVP350_42 [uncultured Caudovirales phage]|uniref:Uncharacterized protein n=1 Tax=uncultured Caudovirales phage TaxID=2100421 RepID=A0A6J5LX72_9CAUD|nr:hypothetical protein UFOVP350_42 [uncultured Caudovirales phage]
MGEAKGEFLTRIFYKPNYTLMRKFLFAIAALWMISVTAMACTKEEHAENNPEQVYQEMLEKYSATVPDEGVEESLTITHAQLDELAMAQTFWPREVLEMVLPVEGNRSRPATYQERLEVLRSYLPERSEDAGTVETWIRRQNAPALRDATADVVAQVFAAMGTTVGTRSSLNIWRPVNDAGTVTFHDGAFALSALNQSGNFDSYAEYLPESVVFEFEVSGGNWLIGATVIRNNATGLQPDTVVFGFNSPNGPLIWNPTLSSPSDDDWIEGPIHPGYGITAIAANGLVPPASPV